MKNKVDDEYTKHELLAKEATPGPWTYENYDKLHKSGVVRSNGFYICNTKAVEIDPNTAFIAASNPDVILHYIALARSEAVLREAVTSRMDCDCAGDGVDICYRCEALAESERLRGEK